MEQVEAKVLMLQHNASNFLEFLQNNMFELVFLQVEWTSLLINPIIH